MNIHQLCDVSNAVLVNSEPHLVFVEVFELGLIHFINDNTLEQFYLPIGAEPTDKVVEDGYEFYLEYLDKYIEIQFYKYTPITEDDFSESKVTTITEGYAVQLQDGSFVDSYALLHQHPNVSRIYLYLDYAQYILAKAKAAYPNQNPQLKSIQLCYSLKETTWTLQTN